MKKYLAVNVLFVFLLSGPCVAADGKALDTETFAFDWRFHHGDIELGCGKEVNNQENR